MLSRDRAAFAVAGPTAVALVSLVALAGYVSAPEGRFSHGSIDRTFASALPTIFRSQGGHLELATIQARETFRSTSSAYAAWNTLYLGTTVTELSALVTYRYHVRLDDPWRVETRQRTCLVHAPRLRPSLPPALHTDTIRRLTVAGWARFDAREQMAALEKTITSVASAAAGDPAHLGLAREACRRTVAEFIRTWLLREGQWGPSTFDDVRVVFADETEDGSKTESPRWHESCTP